MRRGAAVVVAALTAATLLPVQSASAAATHVGLVVRFANGNVATACAKSGGSGLAVLQRKFSASIGQAPPYAGFVIKINGVGKSPPDDTHYWSYWHLVSGKWAYASSGAGSYTPKPGSVEGWSYVNGTSSAPAPPKHSYASLCGALDPKPAPPAAPSSPTPRTSTHTAMPPATTHRASSATTTSPRPTSQTSVPSTSPAARSSRPATHPAGSGATSSSRSEAGPPSGTTSVDTSQVASTRVADPPHRPSAAGFPAWGTVLALVLVAGLGGGAWWRIRRQSG